jgi:guanosine-3',5'-bis(diphosphate) 3'-pyrophosphohydrolase
LVPDDLLQKSAFEKFDAADNNRAPSNWENGPIPIRGLTPGMAVHYASCCHPLPGDKIMGILTPGKGVAIHTRDCETLESFADTPERWVEVGWDLGPETSVGRINLVVANERGALGTLTTVIGRHLGNINNLKITGRSADFFDMVLDIEVGSSGHLNDIVAALRATREVNSVERGQ